MFCDYNISAHIFGIQPGMLEVYVGACARTHAVVAFAGEKPEENFVLVIAGENEKGQRRSRKPTCTLSRGPSRP